MKNSDCLQTSAFPRLYWRPAVHTEETRFLLRDQHENRERRYADQRRFFEEKLRAAKKAIQDFESGHPNASQSSNPSDLETSKEAQDAQDAEEISTAKVNCIDDTVAQESGPEKLELVESDKLDAAMAHEVGGTAPSEATVLDFKSEIGLTQGAEVSEEAVAEVEDTLTLEMSDNAEKQSVDFPLECDKVENCNDEEPRIDPSPIPSEPN
jgi:hypothetical protein